MSRGGLILATTDGGAHWVVQRSGTTDDLYDVAFADAGHGWAVGGDRYMASGVILATSDGGAHWVKQLTLPSTPFLQDVACTDATHVWVAGRGNTTAVDMATSDGGRNWVKQASGDQMVDHLVFTDARHGWALRGPDEVVATSDGGLHWHVQLAAKGDVLFTNIAFSDAAHGWAVGGHTRPARPASVVWSTSDGGATWHELGGPRGEMNELRAVGAIDPNHVVVAGDGMWYSTDAGRHWTICTWTVGGKTELALGGAYGFAFSDATHGFASAGIMATSDGGASWHQQPGTPNEVLAVTCLGKASAATQTP